MGLFDNIETVFDLILNPEEYTDNGKSGERYTYRKLKDIYLKQQIFRNLYIIRENGKYTEIDLVTVGRGVLIVFESKNYSGWIFGKDSDDTWMQSINKNEKHRFYNPVRQNNVHIETLKEYLKDYPLEYYSVIVFSERCELKNVQCSSPNTYIIKRNMLEKTVNRIRKNADIKISEEKLNEVIELLSKVQRPDDEIREKHLEDVKNNLLKCPKCGGDMVKRTAKATNKDFYGCKNYPRCRFTRECEK